MAHIYIIFDFGADEEKVQLARHKLNVWKQAFRLDKKLVFKFERAEPAAPETEEKAEKSKSKGKAKPETPAAAANGTVKLILRLAFSGHEKLTEHRWVERIPSEEPFKSAAPRVVKQGAAEFDATEARFDNLEKSYGFIGGSQQHPG
jgi:hypothetical protein